MNSLQLLAFMLIDLFGFVLIFRTWFQFSRVDFYNPLSQSLVKITQPILAPLNHIIPSIKNINLAALFLAFILFSVKYPIASLIGNTMPYAGEINLLDHAFIGALTLLRSCGKAIIYVLFIGAIMSWFNRGMNPVQSILQQLTAPLLKPIQRILPNTGMIDFSPMVVVFLLFFLDRVLLDLFKGYWALASY